MGKTKGKKETNKEVEKTKQYKVKTSKKGKTKKKHPKLKKAILIIFMLGILLCLVGVGIVAGIFFSDKFKLSEEDLRIENMNGAILDINGEQIGVLSGDENRKIVTFEDMPEYLPKAFIAIEDKRF